MTDDLRATVRAWRRPLVSAARYHSHDALLQQLRQDEARARDLMRRFGSATGVVADERQQPLPLDGRAA